MTRIVTTTYRHKRPPGRKKPVALEVPAVVKAADPAKASKRDRADLPPKPVVNTSIKRAGASAAPATNTDRKPAIATIRRTPAKILPPGLLADTPEEHQRRGDAADALWRELVRRVAGEGAAVMAFQTPPEIKAFFARMVRPGGALPPEKHRYGRAAVGLFPPRPIQPDLPAEVIAELELFSRDKLIDIRSYPHPSIPLIYRSIDRKQLEAWIVWLAADEAWREGRLYRVALWGMRAAMAAALISLASWLFPIGCNRP